MILNFAINSVDGIHSYSSEEKKVKMHNTLVGFTYNLNKY